MNKLEDLLADFEAFIAQQTPRIPSFHPYYSQSLWEMVQNGGKRFRPRLLFSAILEFSPTIFEHKESIFKVALAIEVLHTYSLIHDDLPCMDNASLRRSHPTLHIKYNEALAVLMGDALNTYAFLLLSEQNHLHPSAQIKLIYELAYNAGAHGMVLGQALDCHFENTPLSLEELEFLHIRKTGMLIAVSLKMGAIIAGLDDSLCQKIYELGLRLGLMFQIHDDIIDATQDSKKAGKSTQQDMAKNSYVNLLGLEGAQAHLDQIKADFLQNCQKDSKKIHNLFRDIISSYF